MTDDGTRLVIPKAAFMTGLLPSPGWTPSSVVNGKKDCLCVRKSRDGETVDLNVLRPHTLAVSERLAKTIVAAKPKVTHGHSKPEYGRTRRLLDLLSKGVKRNTLHHFDTQSDLANHIFTRDPSLEYDPDAPIYMPILSCTNIALHLNRTYSDTKELGNADMDFNAGTIYCEVPNWGAKSQQRASRFPTSARCTASSTSFVDWRPARSSAPSTSTPVLQSTCRCCYAPTSRSA